MLARNSTSVSISQRALRAATTRRAALLGYELIPISHAGDRTTYAPTGAPTAA